MVTTAHWTNITSLQNPFEDSSLPPSLWTNNSIWDSASNLPMNIIYNLALYKLSFKLNWIEGQGDRWRSRSNVIKLTIFYSTPISPYSHLASSITISHEKERELKGKEFYMNVEFDCWEWHWKCSRRPMLLFPLMHLQRFTWQLENLPYTCARVCRGSSWELLISNLSMHPGKCCDVYFNKSTCATHDHLVFVQRK